MPRLDVVVESPIAPTFRVRQVAGLFDLPVEERSRERFSVDLPGVPGLPGDVTGVAVVEPRDTTATQGGTRRPPESKPAMAPDMAHAGDWTIGAIVGPSGSGKSTIARRAYRDGAIARDALIGGFHWPRDEAVVDGFPAELAGRAITGMLSAVGFSSPPAWLRPYHVLSQGQRFRCDLARTLLLERELVAVDEFTSVVDRQVARFGSAAVAKAIRAGRARCRRFVAVTCHYDVLDWLEPDWWLDMATGKLEGRWVQPPPPRDAQARPQAAAAPRRPAIELEVRRCPRRLWATFGHHHYLSGALNPSARCYGAYWDDRPIAFCATMPLYGVRGRRIVHRLVVLPDYQGLGVGMGLLGAVAGHEATERRISIVTSHPALIQALNRHPRWRCVRVQKCGQPQRGRGRTVRGSAGRTTVSFQYQLEPEKPPALSGRD